jgi:hypothetical protein
VSRLNQTQYIIPYGLHTEGQQDFNVIFFWYPSLRKIKDKNVADIPEERVPESLGPFQQGTHDREKKDLRFMHVLHGRPLV